MTTARPSEQETGLPSFGENLRREREKRNITLEQISQATKIGTRMLHALEEDKFNQLPGGIFNKGFVRAYARHLGLDEDQLVAEYLEASGDAPLVQPELPSEPPVRITEATTDAPSRPLPWGLFAALLLLAALIVSIWSHRQKKHDSTATPPPTSPTAQQAGEEHGLQQQEMASGKPASSANIANPPPASSIRSAVSPAAQLAPARPPATIPTPSPITTPPAPGGFVVVVQAREPSWTAIQADGRTVYSGILSPGDQRAVRGHNMVIVKAGNLGGINLHFNGKKLDLQGEHGQVRTLTFGPTGMAANSLLSYPPP